MTPKYGTASIDLTADSYRYLGSLVLTGGADAAVVNVRQNAVDGPIVLQVKAAAAQTVPVIYNNDLPLAIEAPIFIQLASGTTPQILATVE